MVAKVRQRLAISKQEAQTFDAEILNLRKLNELEIRKKYQIKISNRFPDLENVSDSEDINRAWESIKQNIKISAKQILSLCELKQHKPWLDEDFLRFLDQRKQVTMQWIQEAGYNAVDT